VRDRGGQHGDVTKPRAVVGVSREKEIALVRAVGNGAGGEPRIDLADLVLRERPQIFGRHRRTLIGGQRKIAPDLARVGVLRREPDRRRDDGSTRGEPEQEHDDHASHRNTDVTIRSAEVNHGGE
jgi:hypothetical protein